MRLPIRNVLFACSLAAPLAAQARPARVAIVLDRQSPRYEPLLDAFQREVRGFFRPGEIELLPPRAADGTGRGVRAVLDQAQRDPSVAVVITLGTIGSHFIARAGALAKPAIAGVVIDASWQGIPQKDGASGVRNLTYVDESYPVATSFAEFHRLTPFRKLALFLDADLLEAIPQLDSAAAGLVRSAGGEAAIVPVRGAVAEVLARIPAGVDAAYLAPLPAMDESEVRAFLAGLNARKLPTLSYMVDPDIRAGALASFEPPENWQRRARRIAGNLQRILAGEAAGSLPVRLVSAPRLTLNLATARTIGFPLSRSLLTDAELVGVDSAGPADTLSLAEAMRAAAQANLNLQAADLEVASGAQNVRLARANLLPQIESNLSETFTKEATAAASLGTQPERLLNGGLSMSLPLYAEDAWAGYGSERRLQQAREARRDEVRLDVVLTGASSFLQVLRARTLAGVRRTNLYRTRSNLEIARLREGVGSASRADIYRWQGEVANARRDLIAAEAQLRSAGLELNRILNRPLDRPVAQRTVSLADPALLAQDSTVLSWLDQPERFNALTGFLVNEALGVAPEVARSEATLAAQKRQHTAAGRAFWVPALSLQGGLSNVFSRGGAGASAPSFPGAALPVAPDLTWQFRIQASLPLFTGGSRIATREQTRLDVSRLEVERDAARLSVDQRVRSAMEAAAASYAAIALTRDASEAAGRNYDLVSDGYSRGVVSITSLIDAQTAALNAAESAANAVHDFLLDLMRVERAMGRFGALQTPEQQQTFVQRLRALRVTP